MMPGVEVIPDSTVIGEPNHCVTVWIECIEVDRTRETLELE